MQWVSRCAARSVSARPLVLRCFLQGLDYRSHNYHEEGGSDYNYYVSPTVPTLDRRKPQLTLRTSQVRKHSGLMKFDSIVDNPRRLARHRNFNNFGSSPLPFTFAASV